MTQAESENPMRAHRAALGMALGMRAREIQAQVLLRLAPHGDDAVVPSLAYDEHRRGRILFGTLLVARWLITGEMADEDEAAWISRGGEMGAAEGVAMSNSTRGYYFWIDGVPYAPREEAARLQFPTGTEYVGFPDIPAAISALTHKLVDAAVVPIENSIEGSINVTLDHLIHTTDPPPMVAELNLAVRHQHPAETAALTHLLDRFFIQMLRRVGQ